MVARAAALCREKPLHAKRKLRGLMAEEMHSRLLSCCGESRASYGQFRFLGKAAAKAGPRIEIRFIWADSVKVRSGDRAKRRYQRRSSFPGLLPPKREIR